MLGVDIKDICTKQGLTYADLGEIIGYSESSIRSSVSTNKISTPLNKAIVLYLKTIPLKNDIGVIISDGFFIKRYCNKENITYKTFGKFIGYGEGAIKNAASTGKISLQLKRAIELYLENQEYIKEIAAYRVILKKEL